MKNKGKYIIICLILGIFLFIINTLNDAGEFKSIVPHFDGECIQIPGVSGAEDILFLNNGMAIISCDNRRKTLARFSVQGSLYAYDINETSSKLTNLTSSLAMDFHPHGISVFENRNGKISLAVINHTQEGHFIEMFELQNNVLVHNKTISGSLLVSPNNLVLINENQMYVTNDHDSSSDFNKLIADYLQLANSNVVFYDGENFSIAAENLAYANGINMSNDGKIIYVAETIGKKISLFSRSTNTNKLIFQESIDMDSGIDNIELDAEGNLWIGSHPKLWTFTRHAKDAEKLSPSQVFKISKMKNDGYTVEEVYLESGDNLSGSSVAAVYGKTLLIGSVFEDHFLKCNYTLTQP